MHWIFLKIMGNIFYLWWETGQYSYLWRETEVKFCLVVVGADVFLKAYNHSILE